MTHERGKYANNKTLSFSNARLSLAQGLNAELQPRLVQALATAAARYSHVMFPENASAPAVAAARALLGGVGANWAQRVYFSADGCARRCSICNESSGGGCNLTASVCQRCRTHEDCHAGGHEHNLMSRRSWCACVKLAVHDHIICHEGTRLHALLSRHVTHQGGVTHQDVHCQQVVQHCALCGEQNVRLLVVWQILPGCRRKQLLCAGRSSVPAATAPLKNCGPCCVRVQHAPRRSSAVEVALKMALRAYVAAHPGAGGCALEVVGSAEGYHGDTLACMDAVAPSVYNGPRQTPWCGAAGQIHCCAVAPAV